MTDQSWWRLYPYDFSFSESDFADCPFEWMDVEVKKHCVEEMTQYQNNNISNISNEPTHVHPLYDLPNISLLSPTHIKLQAEFVDDKKDFSVYDSLNNVGNVNDVNVKSLDDDDNQNSDSDVDSDTNSNPDEYDHYNPHKYYDEMVKGYIEIQKSKSNEQTETANKNNKRELKLYRRKTI